MSAATGTVDRKMTREAYRSFCDDQVRGRFERIDGVVIAMAPERGIHLKLKGNVYVALRRAIGTAGVQCQALPDGATIQAGDSDYEPDATVNCGEPMDNDAIAAPNPVIVAEVLSPSTRTVDTSRKLAGYFLVPSIAHYLIVSPDRRCIVHHRRTPDGIATAIVTAGQIELQPPGLTITLDEIYDPA